MVTLLWKKIKDDGGAPLEHYQVSWSKKIKLKM